VAAIIAASGILSAEIKNASNLLTMYLQKIKAGKSEGWEIKTILLPGIGKLAATFSKAWGKKLHKFPKDWKPDRQDAVQKL